MPTPTEQTVVIEAGAEARVADLLRQRGARRVLLVAMARHRSGAERIAAALGDAAIGIFDDVEQHVPIDKAEAARRAARAGRADWVVAHGGGTVTGFAKAIALTEDVRICAVPTTYAGSERTSIWGLRGPDGKETGRDPRVRPSLVVYDPALTLGLPRQLSLTSLFNSIAHSVSAVWQTGSDEQAADAVAAIGALVAGIEALSADPTDLDARTEALRGAARSAAFIEVVPLGMQHLLAHVLGGTFGASHSDAHTAALPFATAYNAATCPEAVARLEPVLGPDPAARLYDLARAHGLAHSFKMLGLTRGDLPRLVDRALARGYANVRPYDADTLTELVDDAYHARRPSLDSRRRRLAATGPHAALAATERGAPLDDAHTVVIAVHGRGAAADRFTRDVEAEIGQPPGVTLLAPQALDNAWYPHGFARPLADNQPHLDSALAVLDAVWSAATAVVPPARVVLTGFSQGACLLLAWARSRDVRPAGLVAMSGAQLAVDGDYDNLADTDVYISRAQDDPWIPEDRFAETARDLAGRARRLTVHREEGAEHGIHRACGGALRERVSALLDGQIA